MAKLNLNYKTGVVLSDTYWVSLFLPEQNHALLIPSEKGVRKPAKNAMRGRHLKELGYRLSHIDPKEWDRAPDKQAFLREILKKDAA